MICVRMLGVGYAMREAGTVHLGDRSFVEASLKTVLRTSKLAEELQCRERRLIERVTYGWELLRLALWAIESPCGHVRVSHCIS